MLFVGTVAFMETNRRHYFRATSVELVYNFVKKLELYCLVPSHVQFEMQFNDVSGPLYF